MKKKSGVDPRITAALTDMLGLIAKAKWSSESPPCKLEEDQVLGDCEVVCKHNAYCNAYVRLQERIWSL